MRSSSRRSLRRSSRMSREQSIAPAGVAAGGPFLLLGFLPLDFLLLGFFLVGFLPLGLPERSRFATLQQPGILRPKQSGWASQDGRDLLLCYSLAFRDRFSAEYRLKAVGICHPTTARQIPTISPAPSRPPMPPAGPLDHRLPPPGAPSPPDPLIPPERCPSRRLPVGSSRSASRRKLRRLSPSRTPSCSGRIGIDLRCICLAVGAAGRGTCV